MTDENSNPFRAQVIYTPKPTPLSTDEWRKICCGVNFAAKQEREIAPKLFVHKFHVQFSRNYFQVPSGEMKTYTSNDGEVHRYAEILIARFITFCVIHPIDTALWFEGMAVCNPKDTENDVAGYKEAFSRALDKPYMDNAVPSDLTKPKFKKAFFDVLLKNKHFLENPMTGFVLKVRLPFEHKRR